MTLKIIYLPHALSSYSLLHLFVFKEKRDISLFTVASIERLSRLIDLAKNWNGPISAAVAVSDRTAELPEITAAWLSTPELRKNTDIHLLFNDNVFPIFHYHFVISLHSLIFLPYYFQFQLVSDTTRVFPINYLRDLAFKNTRTDLVMFVEGDYVVHKGFRERLVKKM